MDRIEALCRYLYPCDRFADVGCDHGYCTEYMLENSMCQSAVISDISAKSLAKAEKLLEKYLKHGTCVSVCCNGLEKIPADCDEVLIAGMGGEEIISILENGFIPGKFVFQPMKNAPKLREYLISVGAHIDKDDVFECDGKFYFVITGFRTGEKNEYTPEQIKFGKGDIGGALGRYLAAEAAKKRAYLNGQLRPSDIEKISGELKIIESVSENESR